MTLARRLSAVESSLTPTQLVVRWLDEAHAHGSFVGYSRALLDVGPDDVPLSRLVRQARRGASASLWGRRREDEAKAVVKALRETLFRFFLVLRISVVTHEQLEKEIYIGAATASMVALLVEQDRDGSDYDERLSQACSVMMTRVAQLDGLAEARRLAAERTSTAVRRCSPMTSRRGTGSWGKRASGRRWLSDWPSLTAWLSRARISRLPIGSTRY